MTPVEAAREPRRRKVIILIAISCCLFGFARQPLLSTGPVQVDVGGDGLAWGGEGLACRAPSFAPSLPELPLGDEWTVRRCPTGYWFTTPEADQAAVERILHERGEPVIRQIWGRGGAWSEPDTVRLSLRVGGARPPQVVRVSRAAHGGVVTVVRWPKRVLTITRGAISASQWDELMACLDDTHFWRAQPNCPNGAVRDVGYLLFEASVLGVHRALVQGPAYELPAPRAITRCAPIVEALAKLAIEEADR